MIYQVDLIKLVSLTIYLTILTWYVIFMINSYKRQKKREKDIDKYIKKLEDSLKKPVDIQANCKVINNLCDEISQKNDV